MLALAVGLLVAILAVAVQASRADAGPGGHAAELVPASALAYARVSTDPDDPAARDLARLAPKLPGYARLREQALSAVSPAPGAFDLQRDVRPWLGDEAAVALVDLGGGRFGSLVIAQVSNRPRAEALLQRVAGTRPAVRYGKTVIRRFGENAAAFVKGYLVAGPELAVQRSIDASRGDSRALADAPAFRARARRRAAPGALLPLGAGPARHARRRDVGRGRRAARPARPQGLGAAAAADDDSLRVRVRSVGTGSAARGSGAALAARVPAGAIAMLAAPGCRVGRRRGREGGRRGRRPTRSGAAFSEQAALDVDRDLVGQLKGGFTAWLSPGDAAPVIGLAARTDDPKALRETLARLQDPVARALAEDPEAPPVFSTREVAGVDTYSLRAPTASRPPTRSRARPSSSPPRPQAVERLPRQARPAPEGQQELPRGDPPGTAQNRVARLLRRTPAPHARRADRVDRRGPPPGPRRQRSHPA